MKHTINCPNCGIVLNNASDVYCDKCGEYFDRIKFGDIWYDVDELEEDNPYT
jgi:Zn finger protein HypA/HybF involved in hydrogenase expression